MLPILRFGVCRSSDLSIHVRRIFPRTNALLQPSLGAMTALPMTGFHRAQISLHGKQYFRNTATFGILPSPLHSMIHRLQTERRDSFRVRDSHPIPLFSWNKNACPFGTAGAVCTASASVRVAHLPQKPVIDSFFIFVFAFPAKRQKRLPFLRQSASITYILFYTWLFPRI